MKSSTVFRRLIGIACTLSASIALAMNTGEIAQRTSELQLRHVIEPILQKYCPDECKLLAVNMTVDIATPDEIAPGFDQVDPKTDASLEPSSATVKLLIDDKVGPNSRRNLLELLQQNVDVMNYPVSIVPQITHFPEPIGSSSKVAELRDKVIRQFRTEIEDLFTQFCPRQCMLADLDLKADSVNPEEAQYGAAGEFVQDGGAALKITDLSGTILTDESLTAEEQKNMVEMARLRTNHFKNVTLNSRSIKFPSPVLNGGMVGEGTNERGLAGSNSSNKSKSESNSSTNSTSQSSDSKSFNNSSQSQQDSRTSENNTKQEKFERFEKIERVENGDAVQKELEKFKVYGLVFACSILALLVFIAIASLRVKVSAIGGGVQKALGSIGNMVSDPLGGNDSTRTHAETREPPTRSEQTQTIGRRYEIDSLIEELMAIYAQQPKVAKQVFSRVLTEEGVETTAAYIQIFGETIVIDMLRDPSLQADINELTEFYAKNPVEISDEDKLDLLRKLHNRTVAGKLVVMGNRSSNLFDFLAEMDGTQIMELVRNESLTVKAIVLTQCDTSKRTTIYAQLDEDTRMKLLNELSRIDYLPRDYIFNVANALKRKRRENPRLNTEALPGSEVLVTLLERTGTQMQKTVVKNLEATNPESARTVKNKLVSIDTLCFLRDGQLLEVVLSLKHDELLQFLKGAAQEVRTAIFSKSPKELVSELEEELSQVSLINRDVYSAIERKVLNRMKMMANEGLINLIETNERMFASVTTDGSSYFTAGPPGSDSTAPTANIKKVSGW